MRNLSHLSADVLHSHVVEMQEKKQRDQIILFRQAIKILLSEHPSKERDAIINETRLDIEAKYRLEQITMAERQHLLGLLEPLL